MSAFARRKETSSTTQTRNKRIAAEYGCILTGRRDGVDPAHWPVRQSQGAGWGLLEFVPLSRYWHERLDAGDPLAARLVSTAARRYWECIIRRYPEEYLGPPERVKEVMDELSR